MDYLNSFGFSNLIVFAIRNVMLVFTFNCGLGTKDSSRKSTNFSSFVKLFLNNSSFLVRYMALLSKADQFHSYQPVVPSTEMDFSSGLGFCALYLAVLCLLKHSGHDTNYHSSSSSTAFFLKWTFSASLLVAEIRQLLCLNLSFLFPL